MQYCDLSLASPAENLACDEALLELCEAGQVGELLRLWEPAQYFVVVGYGNQVATEVQIAFCNANSIPILRRCTGGGTVLQGPGVLNYTLILRIDPRGPLHGIASTNQWILKHHQTALTSCLGKSVELQGHTDLAIEGRKISGNAQRRGKQSLLFHGCFLLDLDFAFLERV